MTSFGGPDFSRLQRREAPGAPTTGPGRATAVGRAGRRTVGMGRTVGICLAVVALVVGGVVAYRQLHPSGRAVAATVPPGSGHGYLVPASTRVDDVCLDKSKSVDQDLRLATRATTLLERQVPALQPKPTTPYTTKATAPVTGVDVAVRVVRANSYATTMDLRYIVSTQMPKTPGLSAARPTMDPGAAANWDLDEATVQRAQAVAAGAQRTVGSTLAELSSLKSNGSDVVGCVAADLAARGARTPVNLLIVSDLQTFSPLRRDGTRNLPYTGSFPLARVVIAQACPSGDEATCTGQLATFTGLLARLGIDSSHIVVRPSDSLTKAFALWAG